MPFPAGVQTVTVTGGTAGYRRPDGTPYSGQIQFTPDEPRIASAEHDVIVHGTVTAVLDAEGRFTVELVATDADGFLPTGWSYRVDELWTDTPGRSYLLALPAAVSDVALPDVT